MAGATLFRPPPSLRWSVVGAGSITSWNYQSTRTRRPPSIVSMSQSHHQSNTKPAAFDGLRAVHTPAPTPVLGGFQSTTDAYCSRSSRGQNKNNARLIPKAQLDSFTSGFMNIVTLVRDAFRGSSGTQKSVGLLTRARFHSLVEQVMDIIALAVYEIQWLGELTFGSRNVLLSLISQYVSFFLMEQVYREAFSMLRFGGALKRCGTYLTKLAKEGKFDPVIGRQNQIEQVVQILSRRFKNNPCLIGDPGVGKTAIVEGLAQLIATGNVPATLRGKKVIAIDMTGLLDGTHYRGDFESRMKNLLNEVKRSGNVILFIDEIHTIIGAGSCEGSAADVADMFKPALARGELQCIGATTTNEYKKHIEKDPALERRFGPVKIPEPTVDQSIGILRGLRERYEKHHKVQYADEALIAAAELSHKYISARFLPDKAIDLIDQAGSLVSLRHAQRKPSKEVKYLEAELNRIVKEKDNAVQRERLIRAKLLRDLKTEFNRIIKEKEDAIHREDFKRAKELRDRELELNRIIEDFDGVVHRESIKWMKELLDRELELRSLIEKMEDDDDDVKNAGVSARSVVTEEDIRHIVSTWTGVPVQKITTDETNRLLNMEETLHRRVIGQHDAVTAISRAIRRARAGLNEPGRPIGSFVFAGPTGVGKTELAKALAAFYYGSEDAMVRLDMSEFMDKHTVCRLIGTPPGYREHAEGVQLTEAVRRRPHTLILFDEIEKAHPDVFNVMLEILDDGRLTDGKGRTVDFRNTLIIMTSNIGGSVVVHGAGMSYERIKDLIGEEMRLHFRPEFLNRLDETIVFKQLTKVEVKEIAGIMLSHVAARVKGKGIELQVTDTFKELVVEEGFDPSYGVRPLKRAILRLLEDTLADKMLAGEIKERDSVTVDVDLAGNVVLKQNNRLM